MTIIAALLWRKTKKPDICTIIFDLESMEFISAPKKSHVSKSLFLFRRDVKAIIRGFASEIADVAKKSDQKIIIEYKIGFNVKTIPWIKLSPESKFVKRSFLTSVKKLQKKFKQIKLQAQLRRKLSGKSLIRTKSELRHLELVSRKRNSGFEYQLWVVALHLTPKSYNKTLSGLRNHLLDLYWDNPE